MPKQYQSVRDDSRRPRRYDPWYAGRARTLIQWYTGVGPTNELGNQIAGLGDKIGGPRKVMLRVIYGQEKSTSEQLRHEATHELIDRFDPAIQPGCVAIDTVNGRVFNVTFVHDVDGKRKTLVAWVKERAA